MTDSNKERNAISLSQIVSDKLPLLGSTFQGSNLRCRAPTPPPSSMASTLEVSILNKPRGCYPKTATYGGNPPYSSEAFLTNTASAAISSKSTFKFSFQQTDYILLITLRNKS